MKNMALLPLYLALSLAAGCATYPVNAPLDRYDPSTGYRFRNIARGENSDELFIVLTFSGGGTRAASLSYGVLQQLDNTCIEIDGRQCRLLDEVDIISSVSGGSFTAAYYALFGDRIFADYEKRFLKKDVQGTLLGRVLSPWNWLHAMSGLFGRTDVAAEFYDEKIFEGKTFADLAALNRRPFIIINSTDMTLGAPFHFTQDQFDLLYSDLSSFPVSRAVAASSAFPILLSPIALYNHPAGADYAEPTWVTDALCDSNCSLRQSLRARHAHSYSDKQNRPHIHLIDGGVSDNLGLRPVLHSLGDYDCDWSLLQMLADRKVKKVAFIVVNARTEPDTSWDKRPKEPGIRKVASATISGFLDNYTFESSALLEERLQTLTQQLQSQPAAWAADSNNCPYGTPASPESVTFYSIEVCFDNIEDPAQKRYFKSLPTTFTLKKKQVDCLKKIGAQLLAESPQFHALVHDLNGSVPTIANADLAVDCNSCK